MAQNNASSSITRPSEGLTRHAGEIAPWSLWDDMASFHRQMDEFFSRAFGYTPLSRMIPSELGGLPDVDVYETGDKVIVEASVPGFKQNELTVTATPDSVQIEGERKTQPADDKVRHHRRGSVSSQTRFSGNFMLPAEINPNSIDAHLQDGVLRIQLPKSEQARQKSVKVNIT